jgi:hypothetical protein
MSKILADARRFLSEDVVTPSSPSVLSATLLPMSSPASVAASSSAASWSTPTADEANQQFIISILDDNLHGAYEQELFDVRFRVFQRFFVLP